MYVCDNPVSVPACTCSRAVLALLVCVGERDSGPATFGHTCNLLASIALSRFITQARFFPETFCLFNMNNGHLFNETERSRLESFLPSCVCRALSLAQPCQLRVSVPSADQSLPRYRISNVDHGLLYTDGCGDGPALWSTARGDRLHIARLVQPGGGEARGVWGSALVYAHRILSYRYPLLRNRCAVVSLPQHATHSSCILTSQVSIPEGLCPADGM